MQFLRRLLLKICKLLLAVALCIVIAMILLRLDPVNDLFLGLIKTQVEKTTGWQLKALAMDRLSPFSLRMRGVELSSPNGTQILAERLSLTFEPYQLLLGKVVFPSVLIRDVTVIPSKSLSSEESNGGAVSLAFAPLGIEIENYKIINLKLVKEWLPTNTSLPPAINLHGQVRMNGRLGTAAVEITVSDTAAPERYTVGLLSAYQYGETLQLNMHLAEDSEGLLHDTTNMMKAYSIEIAAHSTMRWDKPPYPAEDLLSRCSAKGHFSFFCMHDEDENLPIGLLGDETSIKGNFQWAPWQGLKVQDLSGSTQFDGSVLQLTGALHLDRHLQLHNGDFNAEINDLAPTQHLTGIPSKGSIAASGTIQGPWNTPTVDVMVKTADLNIHGRHLGTFSLHSQTHCSSEAISGSAALACSIGSVKTKSTFDVKWGYGPKLAIQNFRGQSSSSSVRGNVDVWLTSLLLDGQLEGETGDVTQLLPKDWGFARGAGSLSLHLRSLEGEGPQGADIQAEINNLHLKDILSDYMHVEAHLNNILDHPEGDIKVIARELTAGNARLKDLQLETTVPTDNSPWQYQLQANGRWESKFRLMASGQVTPSSENQYLTIEQFSGKIRGYPFQLTSPISASRTSQKLTISPITLKVGQGSVQVKESYATADDARLSLKVSSMPMELLKSLAPELPLQGTLSGELEAHGPPSHPSATIRLEADHVLLANEGLLNVPPLRARAEGVIEGDILKAKADVIGIGDRPVAVTAELPVNLSLLPFHLAVALDKPFHATINADGEVSPLLQLLVSDTSSLTGQAQVALDISGTYQAPLVNGTLDLRNCTYEGLDTGFVLRNIQAQFVGRGNELVLTLATAQDDRQGTVSASGIVQLDPTRNYPFDVGFQLANATILRRDYMQGTATGEVHLLGDLDNMALQGHLTANNFTITIPKEMPTPATALDITFINTPASQTSISALPAKEEHPIHLEVSMDMPGRVFIRSEDLFSEWAGNITIIGTSLAPTLYGELRVMRGDYRVNGKPFQLDKGTITFAGDIEKKTTLYVVASQDIDEFTIEAVLRGPLRAPQVILRSNPHMSQREILSWLIFGRGLNDVTRLENDQAGQAAVDLSKTNQSNTISMMERLRRLGIDRIDFNNNDMDNMSVNVGKYLSRDIFISVNRGITSESNQICVEANLIKHVKLQAQIDDEATGGVSLMWKHDY